jgi:DNA-binding NarL/FixJ family response regulator
VTPESSVAASGPPATAVWIVEDNDLYRRSLAVALAEAPGLACPLAVGSCEEALAALDNGLLPDIVLMDIGLPGLSGIDGAKQVRSLAPACRVVMLTVHEEDEKVFAALCAGASGYLLKPAPVEAIVEAIRQVSRGAAPINGYIAAKVLAMFSRLPAPRGGPEGYGLTPREKEILQLLVDGLTMKQIAARLVVSYHTIDSHLRNIYDKLHVRSRSGAVAKALRERLL